MSTSMGDPPIRDTKMGLQTKVA